MDRRPRLSAVLALLLASLLSGCLLVSGEQTTIDLLEGTGNVSTSFVSVEGREERVVQVSDEAAELQVIAIVTIESGDLQLDIIQPDGSVAFAISGRPDAQVTRSGPVRSDELGQVRYRVSARGARNGEYQIFFQPQE
jgi:hypothetical protein